MCNNITHKMQKYMYPKYKVKRVSKANSFFPQHNGLVKTYAPLPIKG